VSQEVIKALQKLEGKAGLMTSDFEGCCIIMVERGTNLKKILYRSVIPRISNLCVPYAFYLKFE